jgi:hypothetical protein
MRLYYFTTERFGLEAIRDERLKIARINELNDPFEFLSLALPREERKVLQNFKQTLARLYGLLCLSRDWKHPLLWGHYADKHRGVALGFDVDSSIGFMPVEYLPERITLQQLGLKSLAEFTDAEMMKLLAMKFKAWSYEAEYRAFCRLEKKDPVSDLYFFDFHSSFRLAEVIIGERSSITRGRLDEVLGDRVQTITSFKARAAFKKFEVVENKLKRAWRD